MKKYCIDCGKECQGKRCKGCFLKYQRSPAYSKHAKYVRSCGSKSKTYKPEDYICPDCGREKESPTSPRCKSCAATKRNLKWWSNPEFKRKMSKVHKKIFEERPERVQSLREGHKVFISDLDRKEEFYSTRRVVSGEEHHWYRDGSRLDSEYGEDFDEVLKFQIRRRDEHCQMCEKTEEDNGESLSVHHIDGNKENNNPLNLIALCRNCHSKTTCEPDRWELALSLYMEDRMNEKEDLS